MINSYLQKKSMEQQSEKNYVLLSVNLDEVEKTDPMTWEEIMSHVFMIAKDQPIRYFNGDCRLKVANLKEGTVRSVGIKLYIKST